MSILCEMVNSCLYRHVVKLKASWPTPFKKQCYMITHFAQGLINCEKSIIPKRQNFHEIVFMHDMTSNINTQEHE